MILLWILLILAALTLLVSYICFYMAFYVPEKNKKPKTEYDTPQGAAYDPFREDMVGWIKQVRQMQHEDVQITTFDGLVLKGKYYEYAPGAPIELMFHGYRGTAEKDLCGGVQRCFRLGHSALLVDQRGSSKSQGNVITFGVKEHKDCLRWVEFMRGRFGEDAKIILCGISMGATTVMLAAGEELPSCVVGVLADCGFSTAKDIICKVIRSMGLPPKLAYPFVWLGGRIFGGFDLRQSDAPAALGRSRVPVLLFHGTGDDFVPYEMSEENYAACASPKKLVLVANAGHGLSYLFDKEGYLAAVRQMEKVWGIEREE